MKGNKMNDNDMEKMVKRIFKGAIAIWLLGIALYVSVIIAILTGVLWLLGIV